MGSGILSCYHHLPIQIAAIFVYLSVSAVNRASVLSVLSVREIGLSLDNYSL